MKTNPIVLLLVIALILVSCKKSEDEPEEIIEMEPARFSSKNFFSGTLNGTDINIENKGTNFVSANFWEGNWSNDYSIVQFADIIYFNNIALDQLIFSFAKSYHDSSLVLNKVGKAYERFSFKNPFKNSSDFHSIFQPRGEQPFFYSQIHDSDQLTDTAYTGLVISLRLNNKWYDSYEDFSTDSRNVYEILKYEVLRENAIIKTNDTYALPYGKVKVKFDCYLKEREGSVLLHLENGEYQGIINEQ